jgi:anaerobic magnesium-protoporphyrin IX monomethyl ester cyclase
MTVLSPSLPQASRLINLIKQHDPELPVIVGGPHCMLLPEKVIEETQADISLQGDGETVIKDIKQAVKKKKGFTEIPGITYRTSTGFEHGPPVQLIRNLDNLPFPARHLVKHYMYGRQLNPRLKAGEFTSIITSRGCPFSCSFCSRGSVSMQRYRMRSTENILSELREIHEQGYKHVAFADDCFPSNIKQAQLLFEEIIKEKLDLKFSVTATRVDLADKELYKKMKQAGVTHIQFGLESGNQDVLDFYHKNSTVDAIQKAVHLSNSAGLFTMGSFILGAPFETKKHFHNTVSFAKTLPLQSVSFLPLRYMIGSELWNQAVAKGNINANEYNVPADSNRGLGKFSKNELFQICIKAQRAFYGRPAFLIDLLKTSLRNNDMSFVQAYLSILLAYYKKVQ